MAEEVEMTPVAGTVLYVKNQEGQLVRVFYGQVLSAIPDIDVKTNNIIINIPKKGDIVCIDTYNNVKFIDLESFWLL